MHFNKVHLLLIFGLMSFLSLGQDIDSRLDKYLETNKVSKARARFNKVYTDTTVADYYYVKASIQRKAGAYDSAIVNLDRCLEIDPSYAMAYSQKGVCYVIRDNDFSTGIQYMKKGLEIDSNSAHILGHIGATYYSLGYYEMAAKYLARAIKIEPDNASSLYNIGLCYYWMDEYTKALISFTQALNINKDPMFYYNRGVCYFTLRNFKAASRDFKKAKRRYQDENPYETIKMSVIDDYIDRCATLMKE